MIRILVRLLALFLCFKGFQAQKGPSAWTVKPFNPPALPLAVRSPYLNTWISQGNNPPSLSNQWPVLWDLNAITGWYASAVVDGQAYRIMGMAAFENVQVAEQTAVEFTATRTSFILNAGPMQINASFISPVEPTDLTRQSLPFSYFSMSATASDGKPHQLRFYSDISGEFIAGDASQNATWTSSDEGEYVVLSMQLQTQVKYGELNGHAQDAVEYLAVKKMSGSNTTWSITADTTSRVNAANMSSLGDFADTDFRAVNDKWAVLGIAVDWQSVQTTATPAVWAIGVVRNPSIQYRTASGVIEDRYPYFLSVYTDGAAASKYFLDDFSRAQTASAALDEQIKTAGQAVSDEYADLLSLTTRQVMGSMDITISKSAAGGWNTSDVKIFLKNMGGVGSDATQGNLSANTVDVIYAAYPVFMYLNPELGGYLLAPLLEYQHASEYTLPYAAKNIGSSYPNAIADGLLDGHDYGIEESSSMIIMSLAYALKSGNTTFLGKHYSLLHEWAEYLQSNTLTPSNQRSADFLSESTESITNQTNLALKGIIGIAAMAKIAELSGNKDDQDKYNNTAVSYISQWQNEVVPSDNSHINYLYDKSDTSGLMYNLYPDKLLQLNLVSSFVYDTVTVFYNNAVGDATYGIPLNSSQPTRSTTNWMMFAASTVLNPSTRNKMVSELHAYAASNLNSTVFSTTYNPSVGTVFAEAHSGKNSPASGAMFALLALNITTKATDSPTTTITSTGGGDATTSVTSPGTTTSTGSTSFACRSLTDGRMLGGLIGASITSLLLSGFSSF